MDQKTQEKLMMYQILHRQLEQINEQAMLVERKEMEIAISKEALEELNNIKEGNETLIPIGGETFTFGKVKDPKKTLVNIGAGILVEKNVKDAIAMLDEKTVEINRIKEKLQKDSTTLTEKLTEIANEVEQAQKQ
ncbi:MAG: prefoldin subunit alpha [Candidatus Aenigmatarchaeota archaeon]|nr:prefoldin subunit alpha [Nanoarchaeota archaeon]